MSPLQKYQNKLKLKEINPDNLQLEVVLNFEDLYNNLTRSKSLWLFKPSAVFYGLYIYGSVGRGKTFLMDLFVSTIEKDKIRRQHFHQFMLWFHQQLQLIRNQQNPIDVVIENLSKDISILCLDEFLIHDITDAMILSRVLLALEKYKISLVTTSNIIPQELYQGGLQRQKFLPTIHWIQQKMKVVELDGNYDYRIKHINNQQNWLSPINQTNHNIFEQSFSQLTGSHNLHISPIWINKRSLSVIKRCKHHIMFKFDTLCEQPRNASDFIELAKLYKSIFLVIDEKIANDDRNTARRFITLIDVLYDNQTPLYVLSVVTYDKIYLGEGLAFEMQRTVSRLTEMQGF